MNSRHRNIQFTCEKDSNDKISFLDIPRIRTKNKLVTSLYLKKTFSGVCMNYNSFLLTNNKKSLIDTLLFQSYNIYADYGILQNKIKYLKTIWQKNSFPLFLLITVLNFFR